MAQPRVKFLDVAPQSIDTWVVARMIASIAYGKGELWPTSVVLAGEYGIDGVSLSAPVSLSRCGADEIHE